MSVLIVKLGASGDVVRTTTLLKRLSGHVTWLTAAKNVSLLEGLREDLRCVPWERHDAVEDRKYDLVINLEDSLEVGVYITTLEFKQLFGAYVDSKNVLRYTDDSSRWFDLSLISVYGKQKADRRKLLNRQSYQELIFGGLGWRFDGEEYLLPDPVETDLSGDVAIAPEAGAVWPMKNWAHYDTLKKELETRGMTVNVLPYRTSLLEHLCDVQNHRCLVGGDSLPMHLALGTGTRCVTLFNCTSPWEIYDYGLQRKLISPLLEEFFYKRDYDIRATTAIGLDDVLSAVMTELHSSAEPVARSVAK